MNLCLLVSVYHTKCETMYITFLKSHSGLRWIILMAIIIAVITSIVGWRKKGPYLKKHNILYRSTVILFHIQLVTGFILYYLSPKVVFTPAMFKTQLFRYFTIEHSFMMILSVALITVGYSISKRINDPVERHRKIFFFYLAALIILLLGIPWPFLPYGGQWM